MTENKTFTYQELIDEWDAWERNRHPILKWIDNLFNESIFGYRPTYILIRPWMIVDNIARHIKWAWQRVYRGWDDRVIWGIHSYLCQYMPIWLGELRKDKRGTPGVCFDGLECDETGNYSDEMSRIAEERWDKILDEMIATFELGKKIDDWDVDWRDATDEFEDGMKTFAKYFFCLWD